MSSSKGVIARSPLYLHGESCGPPPFAADQVVADWLHFATVPVVPHGRAAARVVLVQLESSRPQACAAFLGQRVGKDAVVAHSPRGLPASAVEHRGGVPGAVRADPRN